MVTRLIVVVLAAILAGCGSSATADPPPAEVPDAVVPEGVATGDLVFVPYTDPEIAEVFSPAGATSLADDAGVWEIRDGDRLLGALEVVALAPRVDPADSDDRRAIVSQAIPGAADRFDAEGVEIYSGTSGSRRLFVWFSTRLLVFLQLKETDIDAERVVTEIIRHQVALDEWESLPPLLEEEF